MVACEPLLKKNIKEMRRALAAVVIQAQFFSNDIISHIHSDREPALERLGEELACILCVCMCKIIFPKRKYLSGIAVSHLQCQSNHVGVQKVSK